MAPEASLWSFILEASFVVKLVLMILVMASIFSWTIIVQRVLLFKKTRQAAKAFEQTFWSGTDLQNLYQTTKQNKTENTGLSAIFEAGFSEFTRLNQTNNAHPDAIMEGTQRAMRVAAARETERLESQLSFLATVGSTSPYVGLFGTVWGIMTAFRALGTVQQASIAMVAPGISEALIATAIGLFAAIPAVIAYNRFANDLERLQNHYDTFQDEFTSILHRQVHVG